MFLAPAQSTFDAYCTAKLMNVLFSNELHRRRLSHTRRTSLALHPVRCLVLFSPVAACLLTL